jgi:hypothetical protein
VEANVAPALHAREERGEPEEGRAEAEGEDLVAQPAIEDVDDGGDEGRADPDAEAEQRAGGEGVSGGPVSAARAASSSISTPRARADSRA